MVNRILILIGLFLLRRVNPKKMRYSNSWRAYLNDLHSVRELTPFK